LPSAPPAPSKPLPTDPIDTPKPTDPKEETPDKGKKVFYDIPYGEGERQKLDIFLPERLGAMRNRVPFFMLIHGGSWTGGDKSDFYFFTELLNEYGYGAVVINYRLVAPDVIYTDILDDMASAFALLTEIGKDYMLNTDKAALFGNSAGGHLALLYSYKINKNSPIPIAFVVSQVGPTDFTDPDYYNNAAEEELEEKLELISRLTGENMSAEDALKGNFPDAIKDASPITHISTNFPPTLLAYGMADTLVPYSNGVRLLGELRKHNASDNRSRLVLYKNSGHDLAGDEVALAESVGALYDFSLNYLPLPRA